MAQLLIRNLPDDAKAALRTRAGENGRSMEAEARAIIVDFVLPRADDPVLLWLQDADDLRAAGGGVEFPEPVRHQARNVEFP